MKRIWVIGVMMLIAVSLFADNQAKIKELNANKDKAVAEVEFKKLIPTLNGTEKGQAKLGLVSVLFSQKKSQEALAESTSLIQDEAQDGIIKSQALMKRGSIYIYDKAVKDVQKGLSDLEAATKVKGAAPRQITGAYRMIGFEYFKMKDYIKAVKAFNDGLALEKGSEIIKGEIQYWKAETVKAQGGDSQTEYKKVFGYIATPPLYIQRALSQVTDVSDCGVILGNLIAKNKDAKTEEEIIKKVSANKQASRDVINTIPGDVEVVSTLLPSADTSSMEIQARYDMLAKVRAALAGQIATNEEARKLAGVIATEMEEVGNILKGQK